MSVEEFKGQHKTKLKVGAADSVTRLGQIPPLRKSLTVFGNLLRVYLVFGQIMNLLCQIYYAIGQMFIALNSQVLKKSTHLVTLVLQQILKALMWGMDHHCGPV